MQKVKDKGEMAKALMQGLKMCEEDFGRLYRTVVLKSHAGMRLLTPRDTGWASRHWSLGMNRTHESEPVTIDGLVGLGFGDLVYIFNNVPYIERLDNGWSTQRPHGFTHIAKTRAENHARKLSKTESIKVYRDV